MFYDSLRFLFARNPAYFIFWVTQRCNFRCRHCFNHKNNERTTNELSIQEIGKISKQLTHIKYLTLAGGEPMLREDLADIVEIFYTNNDLHVVNVVTNGWLTDRIVAFAHKVLNNCKTLTVNINISIDGPKEMHDAIRQPGSFDRSCESIVALKRIAQSEKRLSIILNGVYNKENADSLLGVSNYFRKEYQIPFFISLIRGDVRDNSLLTIDIEHYSRVVSENIKNIYSELNASYPFRSARLAVYQTVQDVLYNSVKLNKMTAPCVAGKKGFVLTAQGDVLLCEILGFNLGNIRDHDYSPLHVLALSDSKQKMDSIVKNKCHCTWECFQTLNVIYNPMTHFRVLKHLLKNIM